MPDRETQIDPIEALADEFIERRRRGESPSISEYAAKHPSLAAEIRELFPTIQALEELKVEKQQPASVKPLASRIERLGDFLILREIGRGGMGIVYEAEQESLKRHVAIKVLPPHSLVTADNVKRFRREARIAARLHHTNIVSVFGVGDHDGHHYYVMQLVRGVGMDRLIEHLAQKKRGVAPSQIAHETRAFNPAGTDGKPLKAPAKVTSAGADSALNDRPAAAGASLLDLVAAPLAKCSEREHWNRIARMVIQVAVALQYAHEQGTLHCDIKPANLLVDEHGTVAITDFGVAKAMQAEKVTRTGDVTGTLLYMAPERFAGTTDARSDIYSLGLVLYELVTLAPAFADSDRQTMLKRIMEGTPTAPRKINPHVPRDLETIVLRAIARDPQHRYTTARALGEDLQRFVGDRPILARRATPAERLWRWCRRNPVLAGLIGTVAALLSTVAIVSSMAYFQAARANQQIKTALAGETDQREKAQANTRLAIGVLDQIYSRLAPQRATRMGGLTLKESNGAEIEVQLQPAVSKETAALLENLLSFYDRLAEQGGETSDLRHDIAVANHRVADIQARLGQYTKAEWSYERTLALYDKLAVETSDKTAPDKTALQTEIAELHSDLGDVHRQKGDIDTAREELLKAVAIIAPLASDAQASDALRFELASTFYELGTLSRRGGAAAGAMAAQRVHRKQPPPGPPPGFPPGPPGPGGFPRPGGPPPGDPNFDSSDAEEVPASPKPAEASGPANVSEAVAAQDYLARAVKLLDELRSRHPTAGDYRKLLACCYREQAQLMDDKKAALALLQKALDLLDQLVADFPQSPDFRCELAETHLMFTTGDKFSAAQSADSIEKHLQAALDLADKLTREGPTVPEYTAVEVRALHRLAGLRLDAGRRDDGLACLRKAQLLQSALVERNPQDKSNVLWLVIVDRSLVDTLRHEGNFVEARSMLEGDLARLAQLIDPAQVPPYLRRLLADTYEDLGDVYQRLGDPVKAGEARQRARAQRE